MKFFFSIVELGLIYPPDPLEYADRSPKEEIERTLDLSSPNRDTFFAFDVLSDFFLLVHFSERARLHKESTMHATKSQDSVADLLRRLLRRHHIPKLVVRQALSQVM